MSEKYILTVDQSTQATKALLFDSLGRLVARETIPHQQYVNDVGWVEHDAEEIYRNTVTGLRRVAEKADIDPRTIVALGISNQRETVAAWDSVTCKPLCRAVVWQCARARELCEELQGSAAMVKARTGLNLSPYFSAAKLAWLLRNVPAVRDAAKAGSLRLGTMDSWLIYRLTKAKSYKTDYSNASRTQLFNLHTLQWDEDLTKLFGIPRGCLPEVCMSDALFGMTDLDGWLEQPIPIHGALGDSHGALLGQQCFHSGEVKATYGTGSSVMMQTGQRLVNSEKLVTSLAWGLNGKVSYVLEGNLNYTGAVIRWLHADMGLADETNCEALARSANPKDMAYFVPAFTGLGAPYWDSEATGLLTGITRTTGRAEVVKACLECIAYQITDIARQMSRDAGVPVEVLRADGGPTANQYLMQFQSDLLGASLAVPGLQELSGMGAAYAAGAAVGLYDYETVYTHMKYHTYQCQMPPERQKQLYAGWQAAVKQATCHKISSTHH